jgi:hypothetical protein
MKSSNTFEDVSGERWFRRLSPIRQREFLDYQAGYILDNKKQYKDCQKDKNYLKYILSLQEESSAEDRRISPLRHLSLPSDQSTVDWCTENIFVPPRVPTNEPGQWNVRNVAALALPGGPMEALDNPNVETVVVEKGAQTGLTTTAYCWAIHCQATDPSSMLIVMNSTNDARDKASESFIPLWEDSAKLRKHMPKSLKNHWTKLYQRCNGAPVYWAGANSPGRLGSKPVRRLILDEVDKYPQQSKREAGAAALARQRVKAFRKKCSAKVLEFSTPTDESGEVHCEYLQGDQRQLWVVCPHCKTSQVMRWASFRMDMALAKTNAAKACGEMAYECPVCRKLWSDEDRWTALMPGNGGEWRPLVSPRDPKCWSFRLPSWYSTFITHQYLAAQWLRAQQSQSTLQDFINGECGEPFLHYENIIRDSVFADLEGQYDAGQKWLDVEPYKTQYKDLDSWVLGGVDVQKNRLVVVFRQFSASGDSAQVWAGAVASFPELDAQAEKYDAKFIFIDSRYRTQEVNDFCAENAGYFPCQGVQHKKMQLFSPATVVTAKGELEGITHNPDKLKDILADMIQRGPNAKRWLVPRGTAARVDYCEEMTAEKNINGKWMQVPAGRANHYWDCEVLVLLCAIKFGVVNMNIETEEDEKK